MSLRTLALPLLLAACTLRPYEYGASATEADTTGDTTTSAVTTLPVTAGPTSTGPVVPGTSTTPSTTGDTTHSFVDQHDFGSGKQCDQWLQDCPEGQKCMPVSLDGDSAWESLKCVDIVPNPADLGEPCTAGPIDTGEDTCDKGQICWIVDLDTKIGTCVAMCTGSPDAPSCPLPMTHCTIGADPVLTLCLPTCAPLAQDCPGNDLCIPNMDRWICVLDASGDQGQAFDPCEYANACDPGLLCTAPESAAECDPMALGCCLPYCDTTKPNTCPGQDLECLPWYEQGQAPPGYENVGVCGLPQ